jgi:hypothetical protein
MTFACIESCTGWLQVPGQVEKYDLFLCSIPDTAISSVADSYAVFRDMTVLSDRRSFLATVSM